jgi:hypothetical protein
MAQEPAPLHPLSSPAMSPCSTLVMRHLHPLDPGHYRSAVGVIPTPLSMWRHARPATPPFPSPPARKEPPEAPSSSFSFPAPFHSATELNTFYSAPSTSCPLPTTGRLGPAPDFAQASPSSAINGESSPLSSSLHLLAHLTLPSLSSTHESRRRPLELTRNHAAIGTPLAATADLLLRPPHRRPSSPVRTHP